VDGLSGVADRGDAEASTAGNHDVASGPDLARAALAQARKRVAAGPEKPVRGPRKPHVDRGAGDPQLFAAALEALVAQRGWTLPAAVVGVLDRWAEIVGADIAARTEPESFAEGVLVVRAASTAWATQLRLIAPDIVRLLNLELGHGSVTRIDIRGPAGPSWVRGPLRVRDGRGPRDTYG
jgi:predicted nucleic acid-binding Zn ribbon protein